MNYWGLDCHLMRSNHYSFPGPEIKPFGVCADPNTPTDVYIAFWSGQMAEFTTGIDIGVADLRETPGFDVKQFKLGGLLYKFHDNMYRFHTIFKYAHHMMLGTIDRSRLIDIQIPRNNNVLFYSTAVVSSGPKSLPKAVIHYEITPMQHTAIFHGCKNYNFQMKIFDFFLIFAQNIYCGYTLESPQ